MYAASLTSTKSSHVPLGVVKRVLYIYRRKKKILRSSLFLNFVILEGNANINLTNRENQTVRTKVMKLHNDRLMR